MTTRPVSSTDPRSDLLEFETRDRRYWAAVIDLWGVPMCALLAAVTITSPSAMFAGMIHVIAVRAPVVTEAMTGSTLGKWLRGVRVVRDDGGPLGWRLALKRRAWSGVVVANLAPWVAHGVGGLLLLLAGVSILFSMRHGRGDRGWHDRLAGTRVVPAGSWVRRLTEEDASAPGQEFRPQRRHRGHVHRADPRRAHRPEGGLRLRRPAVRRCHDHDLVAA